MVRAELASPIHRGSDPFFAQCPEHLTPVSSRVARHSQPSRFGYDQRDTQLYRARTSSSMRQVISRLGLSLLTLAIFSAGIALTEDEKKPQPLAPLPESV